MKKGFTLVELSIVLIIIGLIIGGVIKGTDLINSAQQKKIYNTWVKEWQIVINMYQDRTGNVLADGTDNGGTGTADGAMDGIDLNATSTVQARLKEIGLTVPTGNVATSNGGAYRIQGEYVTSEAVITLDKHATTGKNLMKISGMPTDVAISFDTITDGVLGQGTGNFKWDGNTSAEWPNVETTTTVDVVLEL